MLSLDTNNFLPNHHGCTAFLPIMNQSVHLLHKNELLIDEDSGLFILQSSSFSPESLSDLVIHLNSVCSSTCRPFCPSCVLPQALLPHFCCLWNIFPVFTPWKYTNWIYFLGKLPQSLRHLIYCIIHYIFYISSPTR